MLELCVTAERVSEVRSQWSEQAKSDYMKRQNAFVETLLVPMIGIASHRPITSREFLEIYEINSGQYARAYVSFQESTGDLTGDPTPVIGKGLLVRAFASITNTSEPQAFEELKTNRLFEEYDRLFGNEYLPFSLLSTREQIAAHNLRRTG